MCVHGQRSCLSAHAARRAWCSEVAAAQGRCPSQVLTATAAKRPAAAGRICLQKLRWPVSVFQPPLVEGPTGSCSFPADATHLLLHPAGKLINWHLTKHWLLSAFRGGWKCRGTLAAERRQF